MTKKDTHSKIWEAREKIMRHAEDYRIFISEDKQVVFFIKPQDSEPENPYLLYDDRTHAYLYRNKNDVLLLDYLNPNATEFLINADEALIIEADFETNITHQDYKVKIKHQKYVEE
jgi:hypothetical protein